MVKFFNPFKRKIEIAKQLPEHEMRRAEMRINEKGEREMHIEGEKYPLRGFPQESILTGKVEKMKIMVKDLLFLISEARKETIPDEELTEPVREIARIFNILIEAENAMRMKDRWRMAKRFVCHFLEQDDAYRFRVQWLSEKIDLKKLRLSKADKYYFYSRTDFNWEQKRHE